MTARRRLAGLALLLVVAAPVAAQPVAPTTLAYRLDGVVDAPPPRAQPARADSLRPPDLWLGRDKGLHAGASFLLTLSGQYLLTDKGGLSDGRALPLSVATALALGVAKEVADSRRAVGPHFSWRDLVADLAGVAAGALVASL